MNTAFQKRLGEGYKIDEPNSLSPNKHNAEHAIRSMPWSSYSRVKSPSVAPAQTRPTARAIPHHGRTDAIPRPSVRRVSLCWSPAAELAAPAFDVVLLKDLYRE